MAKVGNLAQTRGRGGGLTETQLFGQNCPIPSKKFRRSNLGQFSNKGGGVPLSQVPTYYKWYIFMKD